MSFLLELLMAANWKGKKLERSESQILGSEREGKMFPQMEQPEMQANVWRGYHVRDF